MEAAAEHKKRIVVLNRPNPIGGAVEGNLIRDDHLSFVGLYPLPNRHGMTAGEIAGLLNRHHRIGADLVIVGCRRLDSGQNGSTTPASPSSRRRPTCRRWTPRPSIPAPA